MPVFAITFAVGTGLAGLGGALGAEILGLDPQFPLKFMIYFLIVVTVGGTSSITGPFIASLLLGFGDVAGKYYAPQFGAFHHLHHHDRGADLAAAGPVLARGGKVSMDRHSPAPATVAQATGILRGSARPGALEVIFWIAAFACIYFLKSKHLILAEVTILGLFAISDFGHLAMPHVFAGDLASAASMRWSPRGGHQAAGGGGVASPPRGQRRRRGRHHASTATLGVALVLREVANRLDITGGADGLQGIVMEPVLGHFEFDIFGTTGFVYSLVVLFVLFIVAHRIAIRNASRYR